MEMFANYYLNSNILMFYYEKFEVFILQFTAINSSIFTLQNYAFIIKINFPFIHASKQIIQM